MSQNMRRVVVGAVAIVVVFVGLWLVAAGPASDREVSNLGADTFDSLRTHNVARAATEGPVFFPDPISEGRDIYITHDGGDVNSGFRVFSAVNAETGALLQYDSSTGDLVDVGDQSRHPGDFSEQLEYPVEVRDDRLVIDLNFADRNSSDGTREGTP